MIPASPLVPTSTQALQNSILNGEAFRSWRSAVWDKGYQILDAVLAGTMDIPTYEELVDMLPKLEIVYPE